MDAPRQGLALGVLLLTALAGALANSLAPDHLADWAAEDSWLEGAQALGYVLALGVCIWGLAGRTASAWALPAAIVTFVLAGEELSWGQRIFGYSGPEAVLGHNRQHELNLHNLYSVHHKLRNIGIVVVLLVFVGLPLLTRATHGVAAALRRIRLPLPDVVCATSALLAVAFMSLPRSVGLNSFRTDEIGELYLALTVLAYSAVLARARRATSAPAAQ